LNDNPEILLAENVYDELERLANKYRHNSTDTISYKYNIRNWITNIKNGSFNENLYYNTPPSSIMEASPCYNGNISYSSWTYNGATRAYQYDYDNLNRYVGGYCYINSEFLDSGLYSENMNYYKMGNITHLTRFDGNDCIDVLTLFYNGSQLKSVTDAYGSQKKYGLKEHNDLCDSVKEFSMTQMVI